MDGARLRIGPVFDCVWIRYRLESDEGLMRFQNGQLQEKDEEWHLLVPPEAREALGKREVERQSVLFEVFKSERDYVYDLRLIREVRLASRWNRYDNATVRFSSNR